MSGFIVAAPHSTSVSGSTSLESTHTILSLLLRISGIMPWPRLCERTTALEMTNVQTCTQSLRCHYPILWTLRVVKGFYNKVAEIRFPKKAMVKLVPRWI